MDYGMIFKKERSLNVSDFGYPTDIYPLPGKRFNRRPGAASQSVAKLEVGQSLNLKMSANQLRQMVSNPKSWIRNHYPMRKYTIRTDPAGGSRIWRIL
jgi:hypothetical protein